MSKKNKSKFRKRIQSQLLEEMAQTRQNVARPIAPTITTVSNTKKMIIDEPVAQVVEAHDPYKYVKHDLKKSAIIIGSMIVIIVTLYFVDDRTQLLNKTSDKILQKININL